MKGDLLLLVWFYAMFAYWISLASAWSSWPRAYSLILPATALLAARGGTAITSRIRGTSVRRIAVGTVCLLVLASPLPFLADTLFLDTRTSTRRVAEFLTNDNFTGGIVTNNIYLSNDFSKIRYNWHLLDIDGDLIKLIQNNNVSHIVVNRRFVVLRIRPTIYEIILKCRPALVVPDQAARHMPTLYEDSAELVLAEPLTQNIYVFRSRDILQPDLLTKSSLDQGSITLTTNP